MPKWFMALAAVVAPLAGCWMLWVSMTLVRLELKLETASATQVRVSTVENDLHGHLADPSIHHAMMSRITDRLERIESQYSELRMTVEHIRKGAE